MSAPNPRRREAVAFYRSMTTAQFRVLHAAFTEDKARLDQLKGVDKARLDLKGDSDDALCVSRTRIIEAILLTRLD